MIYTVRQTARALHVPPATDTSKEADAVNLKNIVMVAVVAVAVAIGYDKYKSTRGQS